MLPLVFVPDARLLAQQQDTNKPVNAFIEMPLEKLMEVDYRDYREALNADGRGNAGHRHPCHLDVQAATLPFDAGQQSGSTQSSE